MGSIYIHIPFCAKRCTYCNFYSTVNTYNIGQYVNAICLEAAARKNYMHTTHIETLYFGGGTPSLLSATQINQIYATLATHFNLEYLQEFTLECNPDDITPAFISALQTTKVNRISMGVQSFNDETLKFINRRHSAQAAINAVKALQKAGYKNISIDLIYGIPGQTIESWKQSIQTALSLNIQHISAYNLSFEKGTAMYKFKHKAPDDEICLSMYEILCTELETHNFEHYEISNFALVNPENQTSTQSPAHQSMRSKHNSIYWNGGEYLGLGAGAHSYNTKTRNWNTEIKQKPNGTLYWCSEEEQLTPQDIYNDLIVTALRTKEGIDTNKIDTQYKTTFLKTAKELEEKGMVEIKDNRVSITKESVFLTDNIMREFIEV